MKKLIKRTIEAISCGLTFMFGYEWIDTIKDCGLADSFVDPEYWTTESFIELALVFVAFVITVRFLIGDTKEG